MDNTVYEVLTDTCKYCLLEFGDLEQGQTFQCDSCGQGYHGSHFIDQVQDGYCLTCKQSLIREIDMEMYNVVDFVNGQLHFQAKTKLNRGSKMYEVVANTCKYCLREFEGLEPEETFQCESCGQGYHGWHFIDQVHDGYCLACKKPLSAGTDLETHHLVDFVNRELQFQTKSQTNTSSSVIKKSISVLTIILFSALTLTYFFPE